MKLLKTIKAWNVWLAYAITRFICLFYIKPLHRLIPQGTFCYAACMGANYFGLGTLIYYIAFHYIVGDCWLDLGFVNMSPHIQTLFIQFPFTFFTGFWLNKYIIFTQSPLKGRTQLFRYLLSVAVSFLLDYIAMKLLTEAAHIYPTIARPIATLLVAVFSYLAGIFFTFKVKK